MKHGTEGGYVNHGCRCDLCRKASTEAQRLRRAARKKRLKRGAGK